MLAKLFCAIIAYSKPTVKDKNGAMATITVIPQMMYVLLFVFPLLRKKAIDKPTIINEIAKKIAAITIPL